MTTCRAPKHDVVFEGTKATLGAPTKPYTKAYGFLDNVQGGNLW
jgi:hypothetical protein